MRRFVSIVKATALEVISEPLSLLLFSASLSLAVFAPAFHYHQFGEATRMARDAGLSALLLGGMVFSVAGAVRSVRREIESGTAALALTHPVSRLQFLLAKSCGVFVAFLLFALTLGAVTVTIVNGARIGAEVAQRTGDIPRLWGPSYAFGVAAVVLPYVLGAALDRIWRVRFALSAFLTAAATALVSVGYRPDVATALRLLPAVVLLALPAAFFVMVSCAAAVRLRANLAGAAVALATAAFLPFAGNYCLSEAWSDGGVIPGVYVLVAALAALPAVLAAVLAGALFIGRQDL